MINCCGNWCGKFLVKCTIETIKGVMPTALRQGVLPVAIVQSCGNWPTLLPLWCYSTLRKSDSEDTKH